MAYARPSGGPKWGTRNYWVGRTLFPAVEQRSKLHPCSGAGPDLEHPSKTGNNRATLILVHEETNR